METGLNKPVVDDSELEVLIDLNDIPKDIGTITDEYFRKKLTVNNAEELLEWIDEKTDHAHSVCLTGPMSNMVAFQLGAHLGRNFTGELYYRSETGKKNKVILRGVAK